MKTWHEPDGIQILSVQEELGVLWYPALRDDCCEGQDYYEDQLCGRHDLCMMFVLEARTVMSERQLAKREDAASSRPFHNVHIHQLSCLLTLTAMTHVIQQFLQGFQNHSKVDCQQVNVCTFQLVKLFSSMKKFCSSAVYAHWNLPAVYCGRTAFSLRVQAFRCPGSSIITTLTRNLSLGRSNIAWGFAWGFA